ncbi:MAG: 2-hydroxyacyl-CoA dehydratase family protein, partial [Kiritimatiellae bacterium]|nr:2-hydroxyacyl-CoA dehydratase family protein [Kiritimatiellia bacterium]
IRAPVFVMNTPATQSDTARVVYGDELRRLSRFLLAVGGQAPSFQLLADARVACDAERRRRLRSRPRPAGPGRRVGLLGCVPDERNDQTLCLLESAGLEIALDATDDGIRAWPAPWDESTLRLDPVETLTRAWFDAIPNVWQRPNAFLFDWLKRASASAGLEGWVLFRQIWCDLWHAEVDRLRGCVGLPFLDLEGDPCSTASRLRTRLEAFAETLCARRSPVRCSDGGRDA